MFSSRTTTSLLSLLIFALLWLPQSHAQQGDRPLYKNADAPVEERVDDLLFRMTIEEKIGQMTQLNISMINHTGAHDDVTIDSAKVIDLVKNHHIGSFLNGEAVSPQQWYTYMNELTRLAYKHSRLDIPIIYGIDHVHGANYMLNSTVFPQNINIGATYNDEHIVNEAEITIDEYAYLAQNWLFAPILDVGRNPFWPRLYETFGEDHYVASRMGAKYVERVQNYSREQGYPVAASGKHFLGYSDPRSGWDRTPALLPMQHIQEFYVPPFEKAIDAGLKTIMLNSGEINGIPVHSNPKIVTDLLRKQLGFEGVIVTDWADIIKLVNHHYVARDMKEATLMSIKAGIDMSMTPTDLTFNEAMLALVEEGKITEERIDESVKRILELKFELGLFENPFPKKDFGQVGAEAFKQKNLQAARESIVLMKNENQTLPMEKDPESLLVIGPNADDKVALAGGWTITWQGGPEERYPDDMQTVYTGLKAQYPDAEIAVADTLPEGKKARKALLKKAEKADALIYALGEDAYAEMPGNINSLALPGWQYELVDLFSGIEKPRVLVMIGGRPRIITNLEPQFESILFAGLPGYQGGTALAEILSGEVNPSGKLSITYPKYSGAFFLYNHKMNVFPPAIGNEEIVAQMNIETNLYPFGHGLSYTNFSYSNLELDTEKLGRDETLTASVTVTNSGDRAGMESVLWFVRDHVGTITRPVKELRYYEKISLEPGKSKTVSFTIDPQEDLGFPNAKGELQLEPGKFTIMVDTLNTTFTLD